MRKTRHGIEFQYEQNKWRQMCDTEVATWHHLCPKRLHVSLTLCSQVAPFSNSIIFSVCYALFIKLKVMTELSCLSLLMTQCSASVRSLQIWSCCVKQCVCVCWHVLCVRIPAVLTMFKPLGRFSFSWFVVFTKGLGILCGDKEHGYGKKMYIYKYILYIYI